MRNLLPFLDVFWDPFSQEETPQDQSVRASSFK